ncbi:MAG: trimethylamine methyltransferase family protein [bacterium]|nr:trimethylamine methyltransferase family protein [Acidimicrobiia bacterium]MCY4651010.1 trimethylamine methyltransferase family protein [bacterium]
MSRRRRSGGRAARAAAREAARETRKVPFLTRKLAPLEVLTNEGAEIIEENAETILETVGLDITDSHALRTFVEAGAEAEGTRVRFPRGMCRQIIQASAPSVFTQVARNPERSVVIGGDNLVLVPAYGSPFVRDLEGGRRYATMEDFRNFVKLAYMSPYLHSSGGTVCEPVDIPIPKRHLDMVYAHLRWSDKPVMGSVTAPNRAADSVEMAALVFGEDFLEENAVIMGLCNANSPLTWDQAMLGSAREYARRNQAVLITPFILAGAMAPVTVAGSATLTLAEALVGMAYTQLVRPGAPVIFGSFASSMSMQSGAPTFGTPEPTLILFALAQIARRLGVPFRSGGNLTASKVPDAQAASESAATFQPTLLAGVNYVMHAAGWLEGGLTMGYEKFILDADQCGMAEALVTGVDLSTNGQALDPIIDLGPGQHHLGSEHTLANFETAFYRSFTADNNSYEQWSEEGSLRAVERANSLWKKALAEYEPPPFDEAVDDALHEYMAKKKETYPDFQA